jgi:hypothetical protein
MTPQSEQQRLGAFALKQYEAYKLAAGKTAKSILISCSTRLAPFAIDEVLEITSYDELHLDMLGDELSALFVIISDTDATFNFLVAIMDGGKCILQVRGVRPFFSDKFDITRHKQYPMLLDYDKKKKFDIEKYVKRKKKMGLNISSNDEFESYGVDVTAGEQEVINPVITDEKDIYVGQVSDSEETE